MEFPQRLLGSRSPQNSEASHSEHTEECQRYSRVRRLGFGANGDVHLSSDRQTGTLVAVKTLLDYQDSTPAEVTVLKHLGRHDNVVQYHAHFDNPGLGAQQIVFEYCPLGDMLKYTEAEEFIGGVPEMVIWHVFKHVACGLAFLHEHGVVHGDIKVENILMAAPREGEKYPVPKIADFGAAAINHPHSIPRGYMGTMGYLPPEVSYHHGPASDIFALGCIIHSLALGYLPMQPVEVTDAMADEWFESSGSALHVPTGTEDPDKFTDMCLWKSFHPTMKVRIDQQQCESQLKVYSKLLNHFMMRALDEDHSTRITASQLQSFLPTLEKVAHHLFGSDRGDLLNWFHECREDGTYVTDSDVFGQIFDGMFYVANEHQCLDILEAAMELLPLMDFEERTRAAQFALSSAWLAIN
ncbi:Armadillo-like helical [Pyrenophora seminiperda CCB06]|uniref:non-specific serine/threonine protein kinase n=1 Tax=Pyrenophora seminiperda CCB06 TaxID=1302712 RepID=A0A3M7M8U6_9PLEO|nr:Armadillo-like helical [Pyrenophora seminiperda CCB06]